MAFGQSVGRVALASLAILSSKSAMAQRADRMSAEGRAVFEAFYNNPDPRMQACAEDKQRIEEQLIEKGAEEKFDWPAARELLNQQAAVQTECSRQAHAQSLALMKRLPPADRAIFYRGLHERTTPPVILKTPPK